MIGCDFLIVGGGVIGLCIARQLHQTFPDAAIIILEKEPRLALHASGRNSGILHAGFYYSKDSLKAKLSKEGNRQLKNYCRERGLKLNECGKIVVTQSEQDLTKLEELFIRAKNNAIEVQEISITEAQEIEPRVKTIDKALYSPTTASIDPIEVINSLVKDLSNAGVAVHTETKFVAKDHDRIITNKDKYQCKYFINAGGLYADIIAQQFDFGKKYRILPFKGLYLYSKEAPYSLRTNIYPVPQLEYPFLGVHFTLTVDGHVKIGPTAVPCLWREQYQGLQNFSWQEFYDISKRNVKLLTQSNFSFRKLAVGEFKKMHRQHLVNLCKSMVSDITLKQFPSWGTPGIRAQLIDMTSQALVMDFVIEHDDKSLHVLNAVSPAFTCSMPFAEHVVEIIKSSVG